MRDQIPMDMRVVRPDLRADRLAAGEHRAVARELRWGRANARQVSELAQATGIPGRRVQQIIQELLFEHEWPIGTAMSPPHGNYLIDSRDELSHTVDLLRTRGISNLSRAAALRRMTLRQFLLKIQHELDLSPEGGS